MKKLLLILLPACAWGATNDIKIQQNSGGSFPDRIFAGQSTIGSTLASFQSAIGLGVEDGPTFATLNLTSALTGANGGSGVANTGTTFTRGGNVTFSGAFNFTGTVTGNTTVTFPPTGTLLTSAGAVTSIAGTANEITLSGSTGAVTVSLPAAITLTGKTMTGGTFASPTVTGTMTLSGTSAVLTSAGTTASTSTTTGSLINAGGFGNAGALWNGGALNVPNAISNFAVSGGTISNSAWGLNGAIIRTASNTTFNDSSSSGTVATVAMVALNQPTISATSSTTYTDAANLYVSNMNNGTNVSFARNYAIWSTGVIRNDSRILMTDTGGSNNGGFQFGTAGGADTVLYRSAASTLKTDNTFLVAGATASTTTTTGAFQVVGGAGIGGAVVVGGPVGGKVYTVAALPSAATFIYCVTFVSDATLTAITGLGLAVTGGGSNKVPVYSDGTNWLIL